MERSFIGGPAWARVSWIRLAASVFGSAGLRRLKNFQRLVERFRSVARPLYLMGDSLGWAEGAVRRFVLMMDVLGGTGASIRTSCANNGRARSPVSNQSLINH